MFTKPAGLQASHEMNTPCIKLKFSKQVNGSEMNLNKAQKQHCQGAEQTSH